MLFPIDQLIHIYRIAGVLYYAILIYLYKSNVFFLFIILFLRLFQNLFYVIVLTQVSKVCISVENLFE